MNAKNLKNLRAALVLLPLFLTALFIHTRKLTEIIPSHQDLNTFPSVLAGWQGRDEPIDQRTLDVLGAGEFLERYYSTASVPTGVDLFIGFFASQRAAVAIHSPQNCLPGSGWYPVSESMVTLDESNRDVQFRRMIVSNGRQKILVYYTYYAHGRSTGSEYTAKYRLIRDAMTMNRTDGSIIRFITTLNSGEDESVADARVRLFAKTVMPHVPEYIPN